MIRVLPDPLSERGILRANSVPVAPGDPLDGRVVVDRYRLGVLLGQGGMAEVREAEDVRLGRPVAVKFLNATLASQPELRRRFEDEARSAARLSHPAVVQVFDSGEWEGRPFLVMERLSGRTLATEMAAGPLSVERVRAVATDVLGALAAAHSAGVIHRDVKPGNLLIAPDGSVKVSDFGIAKADPLLGGDDTDGPPPTMTGQVLGTPSYLAPERLAGRPATAASDVWSLGVVCWEALAGRRAYPEGTALTVAMAVMNTDLEPIASVRPDIDPWLARAIDGALQRDPAVRWPSATAMREVLLTGRSPGAVGAPAPPTQALGARAGAAGAGAAAAGAARDRAATPAATVIASSPGTTVYGTPPPRRGSSAVLGLVAAVLLIAIAVVAALLIRQHNPGTASDNAPGTTTVPAAPVAPPTTATAVTAAPTTARPRTTAPPATAPAPTTTAAPSTTTTVPPTTTTAVAQTTTSTPPTPTTKLRL